MTASYQGIPNWSYLRLRYLAYWQNQVLDDCIIAHIQNPRSNPPEPEPWMIEASEEKYLNPEKLFRLRSWQRTGWNWHGDLFLYRIAAYGPNVFAGFVGGKPVFGRDTVWHNPVIESLNEADRIHFDERNPYWRTHLETVDYFSEACAGVEQFGMTDFGGPADWISALMGTERFLIAAAEEPDRMREFALRLADEYTQAYDVLYPRVTARNDGATNWMPVWTDRRLGTVQDDIAITLSPRMYREIFLPALRRMAAHAEHAILHWHDGCAQHVETMAKTEELDVIQFGHDPNIGPFRKMLPYMKKIQAAGKRLFISCVNAEDVEFFIRNLDPRGLLMIINTENDEASQRMEEDVRLWTRARLREGPPDERTAP